MLYYNLTGLLWKYFDSLLIKTITQRIVGININTLLLSGRNTVLLFQLLNNKCGLTNETNETKIYHSINLKR